MSQVEEGMVNNLEQYIIDSTVEVFESMVFVEITPGKGQTKTDLSFDTGLTSIIGLAGDIRGMITFHCSAEAAKGITGAMLGMEVAELDDDVKDAMGEIANMVAGGVKVSMAEIGKDIELAIPTTAIGKSLRTSGLARGIQVVVPFTLPMGEFAIELKYLDA